MKEIIGKEVKLSRDEHGRVIIPPVYMESHGAEIERYYKVIF